MRINSEYTFSSTSKSEKLHLFNHIHFTKTTPFQRTAETAPCSAKFELLQHQHEAGRVSRSLLYAAFAQATGTTVRKAIEDARLKIVLRNLSRKDPSIERISRLAGYQNAQRLKYVFKARFGCSMSDYRLTPTNKRYVLTYRAKNGSPMK